jgi:hypothetical protein
VTTPLPLDDPRWGTLRHAYGDADDVPEMLRALAAGGPGDVWEPIWSSLCHQGDTYSASYAAVPHVVAIGAQLPRAAQLAFWSFAGAVAGAHVRPEDDEVAELTPAFAAALAEAERHIVECLVAGIPERDALWLAVALAGVRGAKPINDAIESLSDGEHHHACPHCGEYVDIGVETLPFMVDGDPDAVATASPRTELADLAQRVRAARHAALAARIEALDATITCPSCEETSWLLGLPST